ncbi:MAG: tetratricopeptide repeat protein [Burkholderiales bacterium]|nr:tetratricopeptide repeat protein [Burkholderiales bacterium]
MSARLTLLGSPTIALGGAPLALPFERRSQLLVYLAIKRTWVGRAELAAIFWPEQEHKLAFANLRKTLFRLQSVPWGRSIELQGQTARLEIATDVAEFEAALREGRIADALPCYAGDLLAGFDDADSEAWTSWLGFERERLRAAWRDAVLQRAEGEIDAGEGIALGSRLLEADPLDEAALRLHMRSLAQSGQGGRARQAYRTFVARLQEDLGLAPGVELQALHDSLASPGVAGAPRAAAPAEPGDDGFVGRSIERRRIAEMLAEGDCRLLSLVGPGGVGKTRLARRVMAELGREFSDGTVFVALEDAATPAELGSRLAREVGAELTGRSDPFEQAIESLRGLQLLLVLDNFEQLVAAAPQVETLLARCPRLRVLVTTRERLGIASEWTFPLEGLPLPEDDDADHLEAFDAVRLFVRAARRVEPGFLASAEPAALVDICRQVGGLPLALELAASWTRVLSCSAIAAELRQGSELLRAVDPSRPARQASIEVVFDHAWKLLGAAEREALARLSVFRGGFSAAAARAVAAPLPVLGALLDKSLLRKEESRFFLHPLLQRLAGDRLGEGPARLAAVTGHAQFFHRLLAQLRRPVDNGDREALRTLDLEFDNGRAAWQGVQADAAPAVVLAGSLLAMLQYSDHRGRFAEGLSLLEEALAAPATAAVPGLRPLLHGAVGHLLYRLDRYAEAITSASAGLAATSAGADHEARLQCFKVLGTCSFRLGKLDDARRFYRQALAQAPAEGDPHNAAAMLDNLGLVEKAMGHYDEALRMSNESLVQHRRLGDVAGEALCLNNLTALQHDLGDYASALANARASLALCERHGLVGTRGFVLANLSELTMQLGELDAARGHAASALELARATGNRSTEAWIRLLVVQIAVRQNDLASAREALRESLEVALAIGRPLSLLAAIAVFTDLLAAQGERRAAARLLRFASAHPAMTVQGRHQLQPRLAALVDADPGEHEPIWSGPPLDELARRIVAETPAGHAALAAALRAGD